MLLMYWGVLVGHLTERDRAEDLIVDGRIILKWFLKKWDGEAQTALIRTGTACCECGNELWVP